MKFEGDRVIFDLIDVGPGGEIGSERKIEAAKPVAQPNARGSFEETDLKKIYSEADESGKRLKNIFSTG